MKIKGKREGTKNEIIKKKNKKQRVNQEKRE